jgi:hypothetical protein
LEFWIRSYLLNAKVLYKSAINFVLWWNLLKKTEQNSDFALFPIIDPKARLRYEILFKKTHPRINLTTLFFTKIYLLNTIRAFLDKNLKTLNKGGTLRNLNFKVLSIYYCFWTPNYERKVPSDLFYDEIRLINFSFPHILSRNLYGR